MQGKYPEQALLVLKVPEQILCKMQRPLPSSGQRSDSGMEKVCSNLELYYNCVFYTTSHLQKRLNNLLFKNTTLISCICWTGVPSSNLAHRQAKHPIVKKCPMMLLIYKLTDTTESLVLYQATKEDAAS